MKRKPDDGRKLPYFPFYPVDHLADSGLAGCSLAAQGVWSRMVSMMAMGIPFGYLRIDPGATQGATHRATHRATPGATPGATPRDTQGATPPQNYPTKRQKLPASGSLELDLPWLIGQEPEDVWNALRELEQRNVFSRDHRGIIYSRRLTRWFEEMQAKRQQGFAGFQKSQQLAGNKSSKPPKGTQGATPGATQGATQGATPGATPGATRRATQGPRATSRTRDIEPTPQPPSPSGKGAHDSSVANEIRRRQQAGGNR